MQSRPTRPGALGGASASGAITAGLNFGDCFSYALSALTQEPLLFKGDDFSKTDIVAA